MSAIRRVRSLFSPALLRYVKNLELPVVPVFGGEELEEVGSMKHISKVNAQGLIAAARNELKAKEPEVYRAFLLGLFAGMRKAEIDSAEWRIVDFENAVIKLEETEWLHLKTQDSAYEVTVDAEVFAELKELMSRSAVSAMPAFLLRSPDGGPSACNFQSGSAVWVTRCTVSP